MDSPELKRLCHSLLIAQQHVFQVELEWLEGRWTNGGERTLTAPLNGDARNGVKCIQE